MSDTIKYSDLLIDYMDEIIKKDRQDYKVWTPTSDNLIFSNGNADTLAQVNQQILTFKGVVGLTKEQVYDTISQLSTDDMSFFSPKIEIYRRLPAYMKIGAESLPQETQGFIYKKFDFVDGYKALSSSFEQDILNGKAGTGIAAIEEAMWELEASQDAKESNTEIYDYLGKFAASITSFDIKFKFDSAMTFFGNNSDLVTRFMIDPNSISNKQEMLDSLIESDEITRNYAYLMYLSDIKDKNTTNQINDERNNNAYNFLIKVGYSAVDYKFEDIINDPIRLDRLRKFNSFLVQYPDYFNLDFQCALSAYQFAFSKDNSISLKCSFTGVVKQGSLRDLNSHRRNDMDFMKVLNNIAASSDPNIKINDLRKTLQENEQILLDYDSAYRAGCFEGAENSKFKDNWFKEAILAENQNIQTQIQNIEQKAVTHFLDDVTINAIIINDARIEKYNNSVLYGGANVFPSGLLEVNSGLKSTSMWKDSRRYDAVPTVWTSKPVNSYSQMLKKQGEEEDVKKRITGEETDQNSDAIELNNGSLELYFFFFGDLVDNIIKKFKTYHTQRPTINSNKYNDIYCLMPNIMVHKRTTTYEDKGGNATGPDHDDNIIKYSTKYFGKPDNIVNINAAYVPISMEMWRKWTHNNIVKRQKQYYHLFDLLNDLKTLLTEAINYKTQAIIEREPKMKLMGRRPLIYSTFYQTTYEVPQNILGSGLVAKTASSFNTASVIQITKWPNIIGTPQNKSLDLFLNINNSATQNVTQSNNNKSVYLIGYTNETIADLQPQNIYKTDSKDKDATNPTSYITSAGVYASDMKLGISHFFVGNQIGLAKQFTFNSDETPRGRDMAVAGEGQTSKDLKSYQYNNVDIKVVGGSFFRPMEMIYVHPHYTFGEPFETKLTMSNLLNIGGYYQIFKVASSFSSKGVYETTLTCKYYIAAQAAANADKCKDAIKQSVIDKYKLLNELRPHEERVREASNKIAAAGQEQIDKGNTLEGVFIMSAAVELSNSGKNPGP